MTSESRFEPAADPRIGMLLQERYRIVRKLGEGGMGAVYEGEHVLIKRRVAIKCLHSHYASNEDVVTRFHREALAATSVGNEHIIEVTDMGRLPDGAAFMVLEFLDGRDLAAEIDKRGPLAVGRVARIASQVCDALGAAHAKGIVHRDLKPENVYLIKRGADPDFVKVLDFGISKFQDGAASLAGGAGSMTRTGTAMGTPYYMAPEQVEGRKDVDHRVDLYALGVMMFRALTGHHPFESETFPMLVLAICGEPAPPVRRARADVPAGFEAVIDKLLSKRREDRHPDAAAVKEALRPFLDIDAPPQFAASGLLPARGGDDAVTRGGDAPPAQRATPAPFSAAKTPGWQTHAAATRTSLPSATPVLGSHAASGAQGPATEGAAPAALAPASSPGLSTASSPGDAPRRKGVAGLAVAGAAVALVGGLALAGAFRSRAPTATPPAAPAPAPPESPAPPPRESPVAPPAAPTPTPTPPAAPARDVRVQIQTLPDDAELFLDGSRIANPFDAELPQTTDARRLEARRAGYTTVIQDLVLQFPQTVRVRMRSGRGVDDQRRVRPAAPPPPPTTTTTTNAGAGTATVAAPPRPAPESPAEQPAPPRPTQPAPPAQAEPPSPGVVVPPPAQPARQRAF